MTEASGEEQSPLIPASWLVALAIIAFLYVVFVSAWQSDDAFILFRTVQNFWNGEGLRWNPAERVQSYSSPLWMFLALLCHGLFGEVYFSTIGASMVLVAVALWILSFRIGFASWPSVVLVLALSTSAAVVDYTTSGLENPLLFLLLVSWVWVVGHPDAPAWPLRLGLLAACVALTRPDAVLFVVPTLLWAVLRVGFGVGFLWRLAAGLAPLLAWEIFSVIYYGSPVPNTALAKLNLDIPCADLVRQGLRYFEDALERDPVTLVLFVLGTVVAVWRGRPGERAVAAGLCLYGLYLVRIGGDFMAGRFLAAPTFAAAALLAAQGDAVSAHGSSSLRRGVLGVALGALAVYGLAWPCSPWGTNSEYGVGKGHFDLVGASGIVDERAYYYPETGLLRVLGNLDEIRRRGLPIPPYHKAIIGRDFARSEEEVVVVDQAGFFGYFAGPEKFIIDHWALSDPLLARLRYSPDGTWRIGHFTRRVPEGYVDTLISGHDEFADPDISKLYAAVFLVTRAPLWSGERWREIWRLNTGYYADIQARSDYL